MNSRTKQSKPVAKHPPRNFIFRAIDLAVRLAPTGWKYSGSSILLKTSIADIGPVTLPAPFQWTWAGPQEIDFLNRHPEATSPTAYARRAVRGDRCLCIKEGSDVAGYRWVTQANGCVLCGFGPNMEFTLFPLNPGQAFTYDLFTYQKYRGRGIATALVKLLYRALRDEGINVVFSLVSPLNYPALRLHLRCGAEPQRMMYNYRIRSWTKTFLGPEGDIRLSEWVQRFRPASSGS